MIPIILILSFLIVMYLNFRRIWVSNNLMKVMDSASKYLVLEGISEISKNTGCDINLYVKSFLGQPQFEFYYWMFKRPFCYNIKKIIGKDNYTKLYKEKT